MVNLNKQRIAVYAYFSIVFTLIFGLSFAVKGDKITGSFILETAGNFIGNISLFFVPIVIFGFLSSLAFSFFIIRHAQEIKREIKPEKARFFATIIVILLMLSFLSFEIYLEGNKDKISGYAAAPHNCIGTQTTVTAQARRSIISTAFTYQNSWTIIPCNENVQYNVYLANSIDDGIGIAAGIASKGFAKSESKQFSYAKSYQFICIQVSDTSVGNNGYACFNVV